MFLWVSEKFVSITPSLTYNGGEGFEEPKNLVSAIIRANEIIEDNLDNCCSLSGTCQPPAPTSGGVTLEARRM